MNNQDKVYFKRNVVLEPLVMQWYAWPHLIFPGTAALNIAKRHLSIMHSYIDYPEFHESAVANPKMIGGPFMNYAKRSVEEIQALLKHTLVRQAKLIQFAGDIASLNAILTEKAQGFSIETLYDEIPDSLAGFVELFYDLNNHPGYRFFEKLLYRSDYYDTSLQSFFIHEINRDEREFVLSTPRIDTSNGLLMQIPFKDKRLDTLFEMSVKPGSFEAIANLLSIPAEDIPVFRTFFTTDSPKKHSAFTQNNSLKVSYFGHACILLETNCLSILTDPVISYDYKTGLNRLTVCDLPDILDYVLITHNHQDHILIETMIQLRHKIKKVIVPKSNGGTLQDPSIKLMLEELGFESVQEIEELEQITDPRFTLTGLPFLGEHSDLWIRSKICYHLNINNKKIMFAADTCNVNPKVYETVYPLIGNLDILFVGMECDGAPLSWLYGPLLSIPISRKMDYSRRLSGSNYLRAKKMIDLFNPSKIFVYAMGQEPWLDYIMAIEYTEESDPIIASNRILRDYCGNGRVAERLYLEKQFVI